MKPIRMKVQSRNLKTCLGLLLVFVGAISATTAQPFANAAGTWNNVLFSVPAGLTLFKNTNGSVVAVHPLNAFEISTAQFTVQANGSFSGPVSGTFSVVGPGLIQATAGGGSVTFAVNRGSNFMFAIKTDGWANDIELLLKAPASLTSAELAGVWKTATFGAPSALTLNTNGQGAITGIDGGNNFMAEMDTLTTSADGTFSFSGSGISGTFSVQPNGVVQAIAGPIVITFFINEAKDIMAGVMSDSYSQELIWICKQPVHTDLADITGISQIGSMELPAYLSVVTNANGEVTHVPQHNDFRITPDSIAVGHTGIFIDRAERTMGVLSLTQPGTINVSMAGENVDTCWLNASRDVFFSLHNGSTLELVLGARTPALANPADGMSMMLIQESNCVQVCWVSETNRCLQASTNFSSWTNLTSTLGQSSYTLSATNGPKYFYRVADDPQ